MWEEALNKLDQVHRERIWQLRNEGCTLEAIAKRFGVSIATVSRICADRRQRTNVRLVPERES
jgi:transcriptional regulator with XRE-family HTH domain